MKFTDLSPERVSEWMADDVTHAFMEWLKERNAFARDEMISFTRKDERQEATIRVGRMDAYGDAVNVILTKVREG